MAITRTADAATIGTTEYSLPADAAYNSGTPQTDINALSVLLDFSNVASGDEFRVRVYRRINGSANRVIYDIPILIPQAMILPNLPMGDGWDVTVQKIAGTDRSIAWELWKATDA